MVVLFQELESNGTYSVPEVNIAAADTRALNVQENLSLLQIPAILHALQAGLCLRNPQLVCRIGVHTNVRLTRLDFCRSGCAHVAMRCCRPPSSRGIFSMQPAKPFSAIPNGVWRRQLYIKAWEQKKNNVNRSPGLAKRLPRGDFMVRLSYPLATPPKPQLATPPYPKLAPPKEAFPRMAIRNGRCGPVRRNGGPDSKLMWASLSCNDFSGGCSFMSRWSAQAGSGSSGRLASYRGLTVRRPLNERGVGSKACRASRLTDEVHVLGGMVTWHGCRM